MAKSQILDSIRPRQAARRFIPRATKIVRSVPKVTTQVSAMKIKIGNHHGIAACSPGDGPGTIASYGHDAIENAEFGVTEQAQYDKGTRRQGDRERGNY